MLNLDALKQIIKDGGSIRTDGGEIVTDPDRLEDALAEAAALAAPKKVIYPSLDELVSARTEAETLKAQLADAKVQIADLQNDLQKQNDLQNQNDLQKQVAAAAKKPGAAPDALPAS